MRHARVLGGGIAVALAASVLLVGAWAQEKPPTSYAPVVIPETFDKTVARMEADKPAIEARQAELLKQRYDLSDRPANGVTMSRGKPVQEGVRVKLPAGPLVGRSGGDDARGNSSAGTMAARASCRCRTPIIRKAAWCFPSFTSSKIKKQEGRDLTRFDLDFDLPDHFLPEFPPPMFLTTRPDLGDVSQGQAGHDRQLLPAVQRHSEPQAIGRACGCC